MDVEQVVSTTIGLSAAPQTTTRFTVPLLLVDHDDIPVDRRYIITSRTAYSTQLTSATDAYSWCTTLWGQQNNAAQAYIGRWISAATEPRIVFNNAVETIATWQAVTDGYLNITDGVGSDEIGPLNFSTDTTWTQIMSRIQTALQGLTPNITGLDSATVVEDKTGRTCIVHGAAGSAILSISTATASTGTDLAGATLLGSGFSVAGYDAEEQSAALSAILAKTNTPAIIDERGGTIANVVTLSTAVNAMNKLCVLREADTDAKDDTATTDKSYQIEALSHQKTYLIYTEHTTANGAAADQNPDAAIIGEPLQELEGSANMAMFPLSGVSESGLDPDGTTVIPLTDPERTNLEAKGCDYLIDLAGSIVTANGLAAGGNEIRLMLGKMWGANQISLGVVAYMLAQNVVTFSDDDISAIELIIKKVCDVLVDRKCLEAGYTITMPAASDFTTVQKATHILTLSDIADMNVQVGVNRVTITFNWLV